jgi:monomeric sarcosine oxidase
MSNFTGSADVIVIGLGAMGSAAAYYAAKAGARVLGIEQFGLGHALGSSYGESRIIRYAYDHPDYIDMAKHAYPLWQTVEQDTGQTLIVRTGGLDWGRPDDPHFLNTRRSLELSGIAHELLTPAEVRERFPQFTLQPDEMGIYQADAGFVRATESILAHAAGARRHGALLLEDTPVTAIDVSPDHVTVQTPNGVYSAARLVVTAGPWMGKIARQMGVNLPLQPTREILAFFATGQPELFTPERCPVWIYHGERLYYGIPNADGVSGFKVARHGRHEPTDPATINRVAEDEYIDELRGFLGKYIPAGAGDLIKTYVCMYTMTPDENFIIDTLPGAPHIAIGSACSGHGFKFSTLVGKMLVDLVMHGKTDFYSDLFSLNRFGVKST